MPAPRPAALALVALALAVPGPTSQSLLAQERPTLDPADYGRWENLGAATLSPDGAWIAYPVTRVNEEDELRYRRLDEDGTSVAPWGTGPRFSADSRHLMWSVEPSTEERDRLEEADEPARDDVVVLDLLSREARTFEAVESATFDASGGYVALLGYAPEEPEGKGADLRIVELSSGAVTTLGNVGRFAWSDLPGLLALAIATGEDDANGVQVYDAIDGRLRSLDSSGSAYRGLAWRDDAADLAVLRSHDPASEDGAGHDVLAWRELDSEMSRRFVLDPSTAGLPTDHEVVRHRTPEWSEEGTMIAVGLRQADPEEQEEEGEPSEGEEAEEEPELPDLQIWHSADVRVFPQQRAAEARDGRRTLLAVWHLDEERLVQIGTDLLADAQLLHGWAHAVEDDAEPYGWGEMFGRPYHDVWLVDVATGEREMALERVRYEWPSAAGGYLVSYDGHGYWSIDLASGVRRDLTSSLPTTFADTEYDVPTDLLPPHGFRPEWLEGDAGVLLYDEHDVWSVALDGSGATRLTHGAEDEITHRVTSPGEDDDEPGLDPDEALYFTMHGEWTEKRGYARLAPGGSIEQLVYDDRYVSGLTKADSTDVYVFRAMAWDDPPDYFASGPDLADARQVSEIDPFISEYAWSRSELVDYTSEEGRELQAVLYYPAGYVEGDRVPTIVYTYEMRSPSVHQFQTPSERSYYNFTAWTQSGYAVLQPDIVYTAREPGMSALASVRAAVAAVVEMGVADPDAVGLIGHSWGGYQAAFLPTRTDIFAAAVAGAPLTDFVSFMGQVHWNGGFPELSHWETGQARMEVPFWEDPEAHRRNSPIHRVQDLETPLLMAFGDDDGTVDWDQGTEFYNFARRAGKQMVLLVYEGEDHGFSGEANQVDYHRRILEWFGHYLKGEPAPGWITDGVPVEDLEKEKRRVAEKEGGP